MRVLPVDYNCNSMTSFHGDEILTTVERIKQIIGEPEQEDRNEDEKVQFEWVLMVEVEDQEMAYITIYDWKEYRLFSEYEQIEFHIGAENRSDSRKAAEVLRKLLC